jgi:hypothetical protein
MAESETATGGGLWIGAAVDTTTLVAVIALPLLLFGLALGRALAAAILPPVWAVCAGPIPSVSALVRDWEWLAPLATTAAAVVGACSGSPR